MSLNIAINIAKITIIAIIIVKVWLTAIYIYKMWNIAKTMTLDVLLGKTLLYYITYSICLHIHLCISVIISTYLHTYYIIGWYDVVLNISLCCLSN